VNASRVIAPRSHHFVIAVSRAKEAESVSVTHWETTLAISAALYALLAVAEPARLR